MCFPLQYRHFFFTLQLLLYIIITLNISLGYSSVEGKPIGSNNGNNDDNNHNDDNDDNGNVDYLTVLMNDNDSREKEFINDVSSSEPIITSGPNPDYLAQQEHRRQRHGTAGVGVVARGRSVQYGSPAQHLRRRSNNPETVYNHQPQPQPQWLEPEVNYEVDEDVHVRTNGRVHGPVVSSTTTALTSNQTITVVKGHDYQKYRVEERTADGFIVGEYGVVSNNDGSLRRGVRYTADGATNPQLIYNALMKFLSL